MCGADSLAHVGSELGRGSSPRVRSRLNRVQVVFGQRRIISACAEQTKRIPPSPYRFWDHLRVCGADLQTKEKAWSDGGSSPRVRSRLDDIHGIRYHVRIISACAEQTRTLVGSFALVGDHLRVCGADQGYAAVHDPARGSSPRVRSRPYPSHYRYGHAGIISACAEQTTG